MNSEPRPAFPGLAVAIALLAVALGAQYAAAQLWLTLLGRGVGFVILSGLSNLTGLTAVVTLGYWASGRPPRVGPVRGVKFRYWGALVATAAGGTIVLGELANLTAWIFPMPTSLTAVFNSLTGGPWPAALFTLVLVAPVTEEALFRGLLLRGFAGRWGRWPALVLSSALFALFHLNVWQALPAFVAGLYLGYLFLATGSLLYPMVAHAVFNGLPIVLFWSGQIVPGYNAPLAQPVIFEPWPWTVAGLVLVGIGLRLTHRWSPLSPERVSDTVSP